MAAFDSKEGKSQIVPGSWVSGVSVNGEHIRGFVRHYDMLAGVYSVTVAQSDRREIIGRTVFVKEQSIALLPSDLKKDEDVLLSLIDLALAVRDEAWFYELTAELLTHRVNNSPSFS